MKTHELFEQKETPKKLRLPKHNKPFWVAIAGWPHEYESTGYKTKVYKATAQRIRSGYKKWAKHQMFLMFGVFTDIHYQTEYRRAFEKAINNPSGGGLLPSGDYEGFAVSHKSAADAKKRADDLSIQSVELGREERAVERRTLKKHAATLKVDPTVAKKIVYYSFVIAHMHAEGEFSGKAPLSVFVDMEIALTTRWRKRADEIFDQRVKELAPNEQHVDLAIQELFDENDGKVVNKLLKTGMVTSVGEMGYGVLSLRSPKAAANEIDRLYAEHEPEEVEDW